MMRLVPVMVMLLAALPAWADLKIGGELKVAPYRFVELTANGADPEAALIWDVYPEEKADLREIDGRLLFVAPPGEYKVKLRSIKGKKVETARATVQVAEIQTGPPKPDKPPENPPAPPATGKVWAIIVQPDGPVQADVESVAKSLEKKNKPGVFEMFRRTLGDIAVQHPDIFAELPKDAQGKLVNPPPLFLIRREKKTTDGTTVTETVVSARPLPSVAQAETLVAEVLK